MSLLEQQIRQETEVGRRGGESSWNTTLISYCKHLHCFPAPSMLGDELHIITACGKARTSRPAEVLLEKDEFVDDLS